MTLPARIAARLPVSYGWVILVVATAIHLVSYPGQSVVIAVYNPSLRAALGLSHGDLAGIYMLATLIAGGTVLLTGAAIDRFGVRSVSIVAVVSMLGACILMSSVSSVLTLFAAFLLLRVVGHGGLPMVADNAVAMWFNRRLGIVTGIKNLAIAGCIGIVPALNMWLVKRYGWRTAFTVQGVFFAVTVLPMIGLLLRNRPADVGETIDGGIEAAVTIVEPPAAADSTAGAALRTRACWLIILFSGLSGVMWAGIVFHIMPLFESRGLTGAEVATTLAAYGICLALSQFFGGFVADRLSLPLLLTLSQGMTAVGCFCLLQMSSMSFAVAFAVAAGAGGGLGAITVAAVWPRYYGRRHLGKIRSFGIAAMVIGSSVSPYLFGLAYDAWNSFDWPLTILAILCVILTAFMPLTTAPKVRYIAP
ncbi:MAG: MFS transporter [Lentisphaeria bacterium]|jgi:MFS family permease|nr:MFS transporter [Lentisphaeria bacterium]MDP7740133.1 MFS transporter [Lentisphaeria bacterium]